MSDYLSVGWVVDAPYGDFAFPAPKALRAERSPALSGRAVQACPAVNELEKRLFVITCPFDLCLGIEKDGDAYKLYCNDKRTRIDPDALAKFLSFMPQNLWRNPTSPVLQLLIPYVFVSDDECFLSQLPPYLEKSHHNWPGLLISARFPIRNWPRTLNWAFEWTDLTRELILKRGDPMCYFYFEGASPKSPVRLVEAELTDELQRFRKGISGMPKFTSNTFSVMDEAAERRPRKLLKEVERG